MSTYVLSRVLSIPAREFKEAVRALSGPGGVSFALADINTLLSKFTAAELRDAVAAAPDVELPPFLANYVSAMVETGARSMGCGCPHGPGESRRSMSLRSVPHWDRFDCTSSRTPPLRSDVEISSSTRPSATGCDMPALTQEDIRRLFELLNEELRQSDTRGELYRVGGAVMCLAFNARQSTADVDALFRPAAQVRKAAERAAAKAHLPAEWLNDGVKGFLSEKADFAPFLELDHLRVMVAEPHYMLAMKCLAMRIGAEFHDEEMALPPAAVRCSILRSSTRNRQQVLSAGAFPAEGALRSRRVTCAKIKTGLGERPSDPNGNMRLARTDRFLTSLREQTLRRPLSLLPGHRDSGIR